VNELAGAATVSVRRATEQSAAEDRRAEEHEAKAVHQELPERAGWPPLPRRPRPRPESLLLSIRAPIPTGWRWTLAVPFLAWAALSASRAGSATFLPSPPAVLPAGLQMASSGDLFAGLWATLQRVPHGFGPAVLMSVPLGIVMGSCPARQTAFEPLIALLRYQRASAVVPPPVIWLGLRRPSKIAKDLVREQHRRRVTTMAGERWP
jgi:NitT/TauT family transport system permease protein